MCLWLMKRGSLFMFIGSFQSTTENTCLLVGLSSGYLHILNTRGAMLVSQQWHSESILGILLQNETRKTIEEIYVIYKSCVCILQSKQLVKSMRNIKLIGNEPAIIR